MEVGGWTLEDLCLVLSLCIELDVLCIRFNLLVTCGPYVGRPCCKSFAFVKLLFTCFKII